MSKLGLRIALSRSIPHSLRLFLPKSPPPQPHLSHPFQVSTQNFFYSFNRLINTSSPDDLDGLIDRYLNFPGNSSSFPDSSRVESEFAFLRDLLVDSGAECSSSEDKFGSGMYSNDALLISNAIKNSDDGFGDKTHKFLRQFRQKLNESLVVDVLKLLQNAEMGVKFFVWAGRQIGYSHSLPVFNALLDVLGCDENDRVPDCFLREIKDDDKEVLRKLLNVLIRKCCRNGLWNLALEELGRLKDFGYKPSQATYDALIQVFLKAEKLDTAYLVHREMSNSDSRMDCHTLGCFVYSLCRAGKWREALDLIEKEEVVPDTVIYTHDIWVM
ncbi:hypothetical protein CsSME_00020089 [Camellia sinensis var. sinensis]